MKLEFIIIADNIFTDADGRLNIIQAFDIIKTAGLPAIHPRVSIVTKWKFEQGDHIQNEHGQKLEIINGNTDEIVAETPEKKLVAKIGKAEYLQYITNIVGLKIESDGIYKVRVYMGGRKDRKEGVFKVQLSN